MEQMNSNGIVHANSNSAFRRFTFRGKKERPAEAPENITHASISDFRIRSPPEVEALRARSQLRARSVSSGSIEPPTSGLESQQDALQQFQKTIAELRSSLDGVDEAFEIYAQHAQTSTELCTTLLQKSKSDSHNGSLPESPADIDAPFQLVQDYISYQEGFLENIRLSLIKLYQNYEPHATRSQLEALFNDPAYRTVAIQKMRQMSLNNVKFDPPLFWEFRFGNYEKLKKDIAEIKGLFQLPGVAKTHAATSNITIAERGDTILEFNTDGPARPVLRFRVSSHMLCEVSPLFAQMVAGFPPSNRPDFFLASGMYAHEMQEDLPPAPTTQILEDGSSVKVYQMPQIELNKHNSLTTLLEAAHFHRDKIPRQVSFPEFVSIAEVCLKYRSTTPVEDSVEARWLPKWIVKTVDEVPDDGLLLICYVFGLRRLFFRMSKSAILNMKEETDLSSNLPERVRDKIITVRKAKLKQIQSCCMMAISEYLGTQVLDPVRPRSTKMSSELKNFSIDQQPSPRSTFSENISDGSLPFKSVPRCPKGDHLCDAQNLGWLMLFFKELGILPSIMKSENSTELPRGSLKELMNKLRLVGSGPFIDGHEACDFAPPFRNAIDDVFNSVSGLTLKDITGQEGWSLSRSSNTIPLDLSRSPGATEFPSVGTHGSILRAKESKKLNAPSILDPDITLRVLSHLENFSDLRSAAMIKKSFYAVYQSNKVSLMMGLLLKAERRTARSKPDEEILTLHKSPREEANDTLIPNSRLDAFCSHSASRNNDIPPSDDTKDTRNASSQHHSYSKTPSIISQEEMEQILWPDMTAHSSTPDTFEIPIKDLGSRFSVSTSSSCSDLRSSAIDECETSENEKYRLESKDDLKQIMRVEDKVLGEESDRRIGIRGQ